MVLSSMIRSEKDRTRSAEETVNGRAEAYCTFSIELGTQPDCWCVVRLAELRVPLRIDKPVRLLEQHSVIEKTPSNPCLISALSAGDSRKRRTLDEGCLVFWFFLFAARVVAIK